MAKVTNAGKGPKGIYVTSEGTISEIEPGQTIEISDADLAAINKTKAVAHLIAVGELVVEGFTEPAPSSEAEGEKQAGKKAKAA